MQMVYLHLLSEQMFNNINNIASIFYKQKHKNYKK